MTYVAYLSHPIGPSDAVGDIATRPRQETFSYAGQWLRFLVNHTPWAIMCPWLAYLNSMGAADLYGPRALTNQIMMLERCDIVVQAGGWVSPHMQIEANHAKRRDMAILDLTDLGTRPIQDDHIARQLRLRVAVLEKIEKRRVWMPPLDELDIVALRAAQVALQSDPFSDDAKVVIARIVNAASRR
jgi:hypothetical protein